jgi:hypothetical protein
VLVGLVAAVLEDGAGGAVGGDDVDGEDVVAGLGVEVVLERQPRPPEAGERDGAAGGVVLVVGVVLAAGPGDEGAARAGVDLGRGGAPGGGRAAVAGMGLWRPAGERLVLEALGEDGGGQQAPAFQLLQRGPVRRAGGGGRATGAERRGGRRGPERHKGETHYARTIQADRWKVRIRGAGCPPHVGGNAARQCSASVRGTMGLRPPHPSPQWYRFYQPAVAESSGGKSCTSGPSRGRAAE